MSATTNSQTTKWPKPVPLNTLARSDGSYVWVWGTIGWRLYTFENARVQIEDKTKLAIPIPAPEAPDEQN